jgi:RNA polymerase-binding transcription factor
MTKKRRLDARTAERLEQFLRSRRARLVERVRSLMDAAAGTEERASADHSDRARATCQTEIDAAQLDRLGRQIAEMEAALGRLSRKDYGWCDDCGSFIGLARLEALPFARRCRPCQSRAETDADRPTRATGLPLVVHSSDGPFAESKA